MEFDVIFGSKRSAGHSGNQDGLGTQPALGAQAARLHRAASAAQDFITLDYAASAVGMNENIRG
jgi:hypothetical protein